MSLVDRSHQARKASHPGEIISVTDTLDDIREQRVYISSHQPYDETIFDSFYEMDDHVTLAPSSKRTRSNMEAPALPQKSALRASRLLDNMALKDNMGLKLGGSVEPTEPGQATPLDLYLSSEEDASSDADDFSDYGYESSNEDVSSPTQRTSHEDTARVVSVVYSGKPSIIDLSLRRRSLSPSSIEAARKRASTTSSKSPSDRPSSPASSVASSVQPGKKSSLLSDMMAKKKPTFLNIDPYANGSTYSLDLPRTDSPDGAGAAKAPRTPTQVLKEVSRTFSLVRKRSRPMLSNFGIAAQTPRDCSAPPTPRYSFTMGPSRDNLGSFPSAPAVNTTTLEPRRSDAVEQQQQQQPRTPLSPVTYNDIVRAAKKNSTMGTTPSSPHSTTHQMDSPISPGNGAKRGILSGLSVRRRSIKLTGKDHY
ncbi:hypothetical protein B0T17DRAFT_481933 [Bombardia bombarda]|uniref:Uncharacterized protein n=1 Tax=Bombardia bombarda TaxID=252184 RepID=A0AA40CF89_9PEZI|nr:hypothetical protein B0T17DRAFT_481933 [Bombardia bombarda]